MIFSTLTNEQLLRYFRDTACIQPDALVELLERFKNVTTDYENLQEVLGNLNLSYEPNQLTSLENSLEDFIKTESKLEYVTNRFYKARDEVRHDTDSDSTQKLDYLINEIEEVL